MKLKTLCLGKYSVEPQRKRLVEVVTLLHVFFDVLQILLQN
jgi:hypothetical protein